MTLFSDQTALSNVALSLSKRRMESDSEDYEKLPLSGTELPHHESATTPLDHLPGRTLMRLTLGCGCISLLLFVIGSIGNQPVLVTEGVHSLTDALCYLTAWIIDSKSRQNFGDQRTLPFGIRRLTVLGGFFIGCFTATSMLFVTLENIRQLVEAPDAKPSVQGFSTWAILVGFLELFFNALVLVLHSRGYSHGHSHSHGSCAQSKDDANTEGALMHAITDLATSSIVIVSAMLQLVVSERIFALVNIIGCTLIFSVMAGVAIKLIKENGRILLQGTPPGFPLDAFVSAVNEINGVVLLRNIRIWQVDVPDNLTGSLVVEIVPESDHRAVVSTIRDVCRKFDITDAIVEAR